ncbi:amino acid adenylation domain-containing protein [Streptomyces sp. NPDC088554]|uniref:amino acid adenylation domain-containing protein n=1 Tax=Streptomyces sp. NPDC088554 TaxID=3365865 RepID=UPI003810BF0F
MRTSPEPAGLHHLLADAARATPDAPAVHLGDATWSYAELDRMAERYAAALAAVGVTAGDPVLIWAEKSADVIALTQAALRLGAVYSPLAPANPPARVARIAATLRPTHVVTDQAGARAAAAAGWPTAAPPLITFDALRERAAARPAPPWHPAGPDDPAYVLYTSGSTGDPKGVCLSHRNALAFLRWAVAETGLRAGDRLANHAPFNFDLSVFDLYGAFRAGASVDLIPDDLAHAPSALVDFLFERRITVWYSVPSALLLMMRLGGLLDAGVPPALRVCVFAGEPFPTGGALRLRAAWPGVRLFNWYGPTETNVCAGYELTGADDGRSEPLPIGKPAAGDLIRLDGTTADGTGEIVVDGPTVMLGYWGQDRLPPGGYRTGDLGRYDADGNLVYLGRKDAMVKVRGHRVEPSEIEAVLSTHPGIADVAVAVTGTGVEARLHAVVVPAGPQPPGLLALKAHCAASLPTYMVVDSVSAAESLPRTANGKTDRSRLLATLTPAQQKEKP